MMLQDIVAALPENWVMQQNRRVQSLTMQHKRTMLDPYQVGMMRVKEMGIASCKLDDVQIAEIGKCSIERKHIMVVREGKVWNVIQLTSTNVKAYKGHGYIIKGKRVIPLQHHKQGTLEELMQAYERGGDCPLDVLDADGLFHAFQGRRIHKGKKKGGESSTHMACRQTCPAEEHSRPWKRGERVHMRADNRKKREANLKERSAEAFFKVAKYGLCSPNKLQIKYSK